MQSSEVGSDNRSVSATPRWVAPHVPGTSVQAAGVGEQRWSARLSPEVSGDQLLSDSLRCRMSPVANAKLTLHLLQVTSDGFLAETEHLGNLVSAPPHRHQAQDGEFAGSYGARFPIHLGSWSANCSSRSAAKLAAAKRMMRIGCVRTLQSTLGDQ